MAGAVSSLARLDHRPMVRRVAVPAGLAVLTWAVGLVVVSRLLRFGPLGLHSVLWLGVLVTMVWPIVSFAPWRERPGERAADWVADRRGRLALTALLAGLVAVLRVLGGPVVLLEVLVLPTDLLSGGLYGTAAFYRERAGPTVAAGVFWFARWYLLGLWLYGLSIGLAFVVPARWGR